MSDKNLNDDMLKQVSYSIVCIERGHERVLLSDGCKMVRDNMSDCDFTSWVIADYCQHHLVPCHRKYLRVSYEVIGRWQRQPLEFEEKQLLRLEEIQRAILTCCGKLSAPDRRPPPVSPPLIVAEEDDLQIIDGIGPKICDVLKQAGLRTLEQLAAADVTRLQEILDKAGPRYRIADPTSWPEQAARAIRAPDTVEAQEDE